MINTRQTNVAEVSDINEPNDWSKTHSSSLPITDAQEDDKFDFDRLLFNRAARDEQSIMLPNTDRIESNFIEESKNNNSSNDEQVLD